MHELLGYVHAFIEERRTAPRGEDLISSLLAAEEGGERLSTDQLATEPVLDFSIGVVTVKSLVLDVTVTDG